MVPLHARRHADHALSLCTAFFYAHFFATGDCLWLGWLSPAHSKRASLLVLNAFPNPPLAYVCSGCTSPFLRDCRSARLWRDAVETGLNDDDAAVRLVAAAPLRKCSVAKGADPFGVPLGTCQKCFGKDRRTVTRDQGTSESGMATSILGGAAVAARADSLGGPPHAGPSFSIVSLPGWCVPATPFSVVRLPGWCVPATPFSVARLPGWSVLPWSPAIVGSKSRQALHGANVEPTGPVGPVVAAALRKAHLSYSSLGAECLPLVAALLQRHLAETRPDQLQVTYDNGRTRTYVRVPMPLKTVVQPRQARRRAFLAAMAVGQISRLDPGLLSAAVADVCRRATQSGGVAVVPSTATLAVLPVRQQTQFILDNNISGALWQRVRLFLGGPASGLASRESLRADLLRAQVLPQNQVTTNGQGAFLVSLRAAVQGMIDDLASRGEFIERALRGADGKEISAVSPFTGQGVPSALHEPTVRDVQLTFGLDKGGTISSCKAVVSCTNQERPCSRGNSILFGVFPCTKDDHEALSTMAAVYMPDIDELRCAGVEVGGERRAVRLILTGDFNFTSTWLGHMGASSRMPCLQCTAMRRRTKKNGTLVDKYGDMQAGSRARGMPRTREHLERMAAAYAEACNAELAKPLSLAEHLSIERCPLIILDPSHVSPMPLHLILGITVWLLRLGIEAVYFYGGLARADIYTSDLARILRHGAGVKPVPYFGGAFEGRQCQRIGRHLSLVCDLLARSVPLSASAAYSAACHTWKDLLPVLTSASTIAKDDVDAFRRRAAVFVDGLMAEFEWATVTPKLHTLACHAPDFLALFGSLGRSSEQGLEAWHGNYNQYASHYTADTFLESCLDYVKRMSVSRAPGAAAHNHGKRRKSAQPDARCAKRVDDKRTGAGRALAGAPRLVSDSCAEKELEDGTKWARDNLALAVRRIEAYRRSVRGTSAAEPIPDLEAEFFFDDHYGELLEAETACLMSLVDE